MAADKKIILCVESFRSVAKLGSHITQEVAAKKRHQRTIVSEIGVFEHSPNRKLDLINEHTYAKCEFNSNTL